METLGYFGKEWIRRIEEEYDEEEVRKTVEDLSKSRKIKIGRKRNYRTKHGNTNFEIHKRCAGNFL